RRCIFCQSRSVSSGSSPKSISRKPQAMLWLKGASMTALTTSGEASASPIPSRPLSVSTRTRTTSWLLAVFFSTEGTRRIWQMIRSIFIGLGSGAMMNQERESCRGDYRSVNKSQGFPLSAANAVDYNEVMSPVPTLSLSTPLKELPGVGPERATQLGRLKLATVEDLLLHRPHRYED